MLRLLVVAALVAFAYASPASRGGLDGKIVGGEDMTIEEVPYQVSVQYFGGHHCGGAIIRENLVITAAHCTNGFMHKYFTVRYGTADHEHGGTIIQVVNVIEHGEYDRITVNNDMAILVLAEDIQLSSRSQIVPLATQEPEEGDSLLVTGWGYTSEKGETSRILQGVILPSITRENCRYIYGPNSISDHMICAGYEEGGKDACQGDSGGPLVNQRTGELVGIVSWGIGCAKPGFPGIFTNVAALRSYVEEQMNNVSL